MSTMKKVRQTFKVGRSDVVRAVEGVIEAGYRSTVIYVGRLNVMPRGRVKATRRADGEIVLSIGGLNSSERTRAKRDLKILKKVRKFWHR